MRHLKEMSYSTILSLLLLLPPQALANPVLMNAPAGVRVDNTSTPNTTVIHQTPQSAIINWHSHDIASHEATHYQQPAGGITLSRIHNGQPTQIFGKLTATGKLVLVNGAGVHFGPGSYVNVGGLIASTLDISDANFNAGHYVFDRPGQANAKVSNHGYIQAAEHGLVALIGGQVENNGLIEAQLGTVALGAGDKVTIGFGPNDQLIHFAVDDEVVDSKHPQIKKAVQNEGKIYVGPGHARRVLDSAINMDGVRHSTHVTQVNGKIILHDGSYAPVRRASYAHAPRRAALIKPKRAPSTVVQRQNPPAFENPERLLSYAVADAIDLPSQPPQLRRGTSYVNLAPEDFSPQSSPINKSSRGSKQGVDVLPPQSPQLKRSISYINLTEDALPAQNPRFRRTDQDYALLNENDFPPTHPRLVRAKTYINLESSDFLPLRPAPRRNESIGRLNDLEHPTLWRGQSGNQPSAPNQNSSVPSVSSVNPVEEPDSGSHLDSRRSSVDSFGSAFTDVGAELEAELKEHEELKHPLDEVLIAHGPGLSFDEHTLAPWQEHEEKEYNNEDLDSPQVSLREFLHHYNNEDNEYLSSLKFDHSFYEQKYSPPSESGSAGIGSLSSTPTTPGSSLSMNGSLSSDGSSLSTDSSVSTDSSLSTSSSVSSASSWLSVPADLEAQESKSSTPVSSQSRKPFTWASIPGGPSIPLDLNMEAVSEPVSPHSPTPSPGLWEIPGGPSIDSYEIAELDNGMDLPAPAKPETHHDNDTDDKPEGGGGYEKPREPNDLREAGAETPVCVSSTDERYLDKDPLCIIIDEDKV